VRNTSEIRVFLKKNIFRVIILNFSENLLTKIFKRVVMNFKYSSFYQNRIYPHLWIIVICIGIIAFFCAIWFSVWLSDFMG